MSTLTQEQLLARITRIITENGFVADPGEVKLETNFLDMSNVDSLDMIELVMCVEDEFRIEIPDEDADKFITVQNLVDYLLSKNLRS